MLPSGAPASWLLLGTEAAALPRTVSALQPLEELLPMLCAAGGQRQEPQPTGRDTGRCRGRYSLSQARGDWQEQTLLGLTAAVSPLLGNKQGWETCQTAAVTPGTGGLDVLNPVLGDKNSAGPVALGRGLWLGLMPIKDHANSFALAVSDAVILLYCC